MQRAQGSILGGAIWMIVISVLFFWLTPISQLVAGFVGGRKAGGVGGAIVAAILSSILVGGVLFFLATLLTGIPIIGAIAGLGGLVLASTGIIPLLIGALVGGALA